MRIKTFCGGAFRNCAQAIEPDPGAMVSTTVIVVFGAGNISLGLSLYGISSPGASYTHPSATDPCRQTMLIAAFR